MNIKISKENNKNSSFYLNFIKKIIKYKCQNMQSELKNNQY